MGTNIVQIDTLGATILSAITPDLIKPEYRNSHPLGGSCYIVSEAYYHAIGGKKAGWTPMVVRHEGVNHWFLHRKYRDTILDLTAFQFKSRVPYNLAKPIGFLTKAPSKRAQVLLRRIGHVD